MRVIVNGEPVALAARTSVTDLLAARGMDRAGIAVAVNGEVVPSLRHRETSLGDGDTVEIVTAVQGG